MLNITEIVTNKINTMIEDETLKNTLESTIEDLTIKTIKNSISTYDIREIFEEKIKEEVSSAVKDLSFKGYASLVISNLKKAVNEQAQKAISEDVIKYFNELYLPKEDKVLKVGELFDAYVEQMKSEEYDDEEKYAFMNVGDKECPHGYCKYVKILVSLDEDYNDDEDSHTYEIKLINVGNSDNEFKITSIYEDKKYYKDLTERVKFGYLGEFERMILNAFFNETKIIINDDDVDSYEDVVYSRF